MKVLILGGTGMLGHKVFQHLRRRISDTWCTCRGTMAGSHLAHVDLFSADAVLENVDASNVAAVENLLRTHKPQVTINCIGIIKQRPEAHDAISCITVNALLPHRVAVVCSEWNGRVIHISTDCVFSGTRGSYMETDIPDAHDVYGRTKALGEITYQNCLTLRTSIIGRELTRGASLLEWFLAQNRTTVRGYSHALYSGVTTNYLAYVLEQVVLRYPHLSGLYQVTAEPISKLILLETIKAAFELDVAIVADSSVRCDRTMNGDAFRRATDISAPEWPQLIQEIVDDPTPYATWRKDTTCNS